VKKKSDIFLKTQQLKQKAKDNGFSSVGVSKAEFLEDEARSLEQWLGTGAHGEMGYMANHFDLRTDPRKLVPGAKSVISLSYNYYSPKQQDAEAPKISSYAYGKDYHKVVKKKLKNLFAELTNEWGEINGRCFVDSAPIMEREWARKSGLGWMGKHTIMINPQRGSYFFLAEIILDVEFEYDSEIRDHCGTCTKCIDACPTDAISEKGYVLDAKKCISYLTIELKNEIPEEFSDQMEGWMFGCDICQKVCPWNKFSTPHKEPKFEPQEELLQMGKQDWVEITEEVFDTIFEGSAVKRTKFAGLKRNINFLYKE